MRITCIAKTEFRADVAKELTGWETDADGGEALAEFAGRACYQSWTKPNPVTATNKGYLDNIFNQLHSSVLEHGTITLYIEGVSRGLSHELVRHRHFSYSQLSQRYVPSFDVEFIPPADIANDPELLELFEQSTRRAQRDYSIIENTLRTKFGVSNTKSKKRARQAARAVLPNATDTKIVVTGNFWAWAQMLEKRGTIYADPEIRDMAIEILKVLQIEAPNIFMRYWIVETHDENMETVLTIIRTGIV